MKLWLKYTLAGITGILLGLISQPGTIQYNILFSLGEFGLRFGRYIIFPLLFFTLSISVCQLRRERLLIKSSLKLIILALSAALIQVIVSTGLSMLMPMSRIPIITETNGWMSPFPYQNGLNNMGTSEILRSILPVNLFEIFQNSGDFILPALIFAFFLGTQLFKDKEEAEPVYNLFDSFGRLFYKMNAFFTNAFFILIIPVSAIATAHLTGIEDFSSYTGLFRIIGISTAFLLFVVYPLVYFLLTGKRPFSEMRAFTAPLISSLFTGDNFINAQILLRTLKENSGIKRKMSGLSLPFLTLFAKAGTAMVTNVALLTILKSYSSLELTAFQVFWVMGVSVCVSFLLFSHSYTALYTALILSCSFYGRGLTEGYILILPVLPVLVLFAGVLDTANAAFLSLIMSREDDCRFHRDTKEYI